MKILTFSTLYPSNEVPAHGIFVEKRLREMHRHHVFESVVIAPVPWFPFSSDRFGVRSRFARIARQEVRHGFTVDHPRYPLLPKIGMTIAPFLMALAILPILKARIKSGFDFDLIDAHYYYPDGVAAVMLGKALGKPVVITARGTDINFIPRYWAPRALIRWAISNADHSIAVCEALRKSLIELGAAAERVTTLRNGVDVQLFQPPSNRDALRESLGIEGPLLLSVGLLIERKGHHLVIQAVSELPGVQLIIAGEGEERLALEDLVRKLQVGDRVSFTGAISQERLRELYGAADALVLASSREGWANVLLESMACGTPVIATPAGGTPEVLSVPEAGVLVSRDAKSLREGMQSILMGPIMRDAVRIHAEKHAWQPVVSKVFQLLRRVASDHIPKKA